ncbi:hypothetical protein GW17_00008767 [Ensete ventricosum]|nr:hypothetical protein GW17_00008767 [Ensete ventricosum]
MHRIGVRTMRLGTRQECFGSSLRVSGACQDSATEFARRRSRLTIRLSMVAEKLTGSKPLDRRVNRQYPGFGLQPKKISNRRRYASRRTREWT